MLSLRSCAGFSPVVTAGSSLLWCAMRCFPLRRLLVVEHRLRRAQAQSLRLPDSTARAQRLWCMDLVALWHVGSSQTRDGTRVSCIGRQILYHWATREAPNFTVLRVAVQFSQQRLLKRLFSVVCSCFLCHRLDVWVYLWIFFPVPVICVSVFVGTGSLSSQVEYFSRKVRGRWECEGRR